MCIRDRNKIDLPASDIEKTKKEIEDVVGIDTSNAISCSGKTGEGIENILEAIINTLPSPKGTQSEKLKSLLVDSWYDTYLGVVILVRVINGKIKKNMKIKLMSNDQEHIIEKVGVFTPKPTDVNELNSGEIGFIIAGIKTLSETTCVVVFIEGMAIFLSQDQFSIGVGTISIGPENPAFIHDSLTNSHGAHISSSILIDLFQAGGKASVSQ